MLAKSHGNGSKLDRKAKKCPPTAAGLAPTLTDKYNSSDVLIDQIYRDIAMGVSRSYCLKKIQDGQYNNKPVKARQAAYYYNAALDRFAVDSDIEAEKLREICFKRYETILEECMKKGDMYNARGTMDSICRIFGIENRTPSTAIQINGGDDKIVVNFGFNNDENEK